MRAEGGAGHVEPCCVVVDTRAVVRNGLVMALRASGHNAVGVATLRDLDLAPKPPAVIVVDGARLGISTERLREHLIPRWPTIRLLVVSDRVDGGAEHGLEMIDRSHGAAGVARALDNLAAAGKDGELEERPALLLTSLERSVLRLIAQGSTAREAAAALGISARTVENHKRRIFDRLGAVTQAQAVSLAIRAGELSAFENAS